ncbi:MAG TPA: hypothetical protein DCY41_07220 [Opitutae bacterium]|jgi:hypothetical protein|nr:hypothetical protein [Opitutae bacterium]
MSSLRSWAVFFVFATIALGVVGVVVMMQVRLQADEVGQRIRRIERTTEERRKELAYIERERSKAQDVLSLERRVGEDLRPPEPTQVIWVRPAFVHPATSAILNPRMAALDSAVREPVDQGGGVLR